jgi:general nucleoside transport system permease protein
MTTISQPLATDATPDFQSPRRWKTPIALGFFAVLGLAVFLGLPHDGHVALSFGSAGTLKLPTLPVSAVPATVVSAVAAAAMAAVATVLIARRRAVPTWFVALFIVILFVGFLIWATPDGKTIGITGMLVQGLALATPIIYGAIGGVLCERVGIVNVAIEGQLLLGAFVSAVAASLTQNVFIGLLTAMIAGALVSFVLGAFSIKYVVNQVIIGVVLNGLVLALTTFLYQTALAGNQETLNAPPQLAAVPIPGLSAIPVIGPLLFDQTIIVYLLYAAVAAVAVGLARTRWGLRVRAVGEHPKAADTMGINVGRVRFWTVALAGGIVGLGGAYFTIGNIGAFTPNTTSGLGYIGLAAMIFGGWNPVRAAFAALLFGFTNELQYLLGQLGSPVPSQFLLMLPYLVTIVAVAGFVGKVRPPAASGKPYIKG